MGCRSDYMEQSSTEAFCQKTAQNIVYVLKSLKKDVPKWIQETAEDYYAQDPQDKLTPTLCGLIKKMTSTQLDKIVYDGRKAEARQLAQWWEEHQKADERRQAEDAEKTAKEKLKKQALKKLTKAERKALELE